MMRVISASFCFLIFFSGVLFSQVVAISDSLIVAHPSSVLEIYSHDKGVLIPRMTLAERNAIVNPAKGLLIFQIDVDPFYYYYDGAEWKPLCCGSGGGGSYTCGDLVSYHGYDYTTVQIGNQCWFAENLRTTQYNDGSAVPLKDDPANWFLQTPGYCWYDNNQTTYGVYGCLYNWYALDSLSNGGKNICPDGWSVPTEADWDELREYLANNGYFCVPGGGGGNNYWFTKSLSSTSQWSVSTTECTPGYDQITNNLTGFNAFPAGNRAANGTFANYTTTANFWSREEASSTGAYSRGLMYSTTLWVNWSVNKMEGRNIRCLKD